jgi:hypothetical protein
MYFLKKYSKNVVFKKVQAKKSTFYKNKDLVKGSSTNELEQNETKTQPFLSTNYV